MDEGRMKDRKPFTWAKENKNETLIKRAREDEDDEGTKEDDEGEVEGKILTLIKVDTKKQSFLE